MTLKPIIVKVFVVGMPASVRSEAECVIQQAPFPLMKRTEQHVGHSIQTIPFLDEQTYGLRY